MEQYGFLNNDFTAFFAKNGKFLDHQARFEKYDFYSNAKNRII